MFGLSDAHHFRKMVAGFCMMFAPLFLLAGLLLDPDASYVFTFAGALLSVPAALGLMHMLREREVALGHVGGAFSLIGLMGMTALIGTDVSGSTDLINRVDHLSGVVTMLFIAALLYGAGMLVLGMGLWRAHSAPSWLVACLMAGGIAFDVALIASSLGVAIVAVAAIVIGQGTIGTMVWRESDEAWERTPELA